jgi:division/cell wall cluster transcriptional repressor MraZ
MDAKNRVTIPAAWLNGGPDEFHAIPHPSGDFLMVMPPDEFDSIETSIKQSGIPSDMQRKAIRQFYSQARAVGADSNGRVLLPEEQCGALKLEDDVVLVGGRSRFEIWNAKCWAAVSAAESDSYRKVAEMIGL